MAGRRASRYRCHGCAPIRRIDLICGAYRVRSWRPQALDVELTERLTARDLPGDWLYVRVEQEDGEWAWSSPIRLEHAQAPPAADWPAWNDDEAEPIDPRRAAAAAQYLPELLAYLRREEAIERFQQIEPVAVCEQSMGRCALFFCFWGEERLPMSIRWFFEFEIPRIRYDWGRRDYGGRDELEWGPRLMAKYR